MKVKIINSKKEDGSINWGKIRDISDIIGREYEAKENSHGTVEIIDDKFGEIDL